MLVRALGHAGLMVSSSQGTILVDPWFSPDGAFLGSWFQYPSNEHLLSPDLLEPDAVLISHEHLDHLDAWFLSRLSPHVPIYAPRYPSPALGAKIRAAGDHPLVELENWQEREVAPGIRAFFVSEESPMNHDSAMVISVGTETLLNLNDARLSAEQLRTIRSRVGGSIDVAAVQGAGASWYPVCYRYDDDHRRQLSSAKRSAKFGYVARVHQLVEPRVTLPFAGPPAFLDDELRFANAEMGPHGIFPDQQQVADWLLEEAGITETEVLLPGDAWTTTGGTERDEHWSGFTFNDRDLYLDEYARRKASAIAKVVADHPVPDHDLFDQFSDYFERVLAMSPYFNENIDMRVGFDIMGQGGGQWSVDFRSGRTGIARSLDDCQYTYRFASRWLPRILTGHLPWEDFLLSLRFEAWRDPDLYNDHLLGLLKFAWPDALEAVEEYEQADSQYDTIDINVDGVIYRIERYCPHAGQDLQVTGELLDGAVLRCLGHHFEFDLTSGQCVNGRSRPLRTSIVEVDDRADRTAPVPMTETPGSTP